MTNRTERYVSAHGATARRASAVLLQSAVVFSALLTGVASGQEGEAVTVDVTECVKLTSPAERLACFEAGVDDVLGDRAPATRAEPVTEARRTEPAPARRAEVAAPARSAQRDDEPGASGDEIVGVIQELRETVPNSYLITLTDGQVWRQNRAAPYPLTEGASVRIYKVERWGGSYRLTAVGRKGFIQVEPVR